LLRESVFVAGKMQVHYQADKMNIAALGNIVPQLHLHHIARYAKDAAWPRPVWGFQAAKPYDAAELEITLASLKALFAEMLE
jgi:diadenosine tetraphosphate (Ap4A) HIT family hydrolase